MAMNRSEKARIAARVADTLTCIPTGHQRKLTETEVCSQLGVGRVVIIYDDKTGWSWLRGNHECAALIKSQLELRSLEGYTTREVRPDGGERDRLVDKLEEEIKDRKASQAGRRVGGGSPAPTFPKATQSSLQVGGTVSSKLVPPRRKRHHTKEASPEASVPAPSTSATSLAAPTSPSPIDKLPVETVAAILKLCFEGLESPTDHLRKLHTLYGVGGFIRMVLHRLPSLWTRIHPAFSRPFTQTTIELSGSYPLSIEYTPMPSHLKRSWQGVYLLIELVEEKRDKWESVAITVKPKSFGAFAKALEIPAPLLRTLRVAVANVGWLIDSPLLTGRPLNAQAARPFQLLGGEQGNLRHLDLCNLPCIFNPKPFTLLISLALTNGVRISYEDILTFLTSSTQLGELRLADVKFAATAPHELDQPIVLSHLKQLVLKEEVERTGIINLYHSIRATNCEKLNLEVQGVDHLLGPKLVEGVAPVVRKTFETQNQTVLRFRYHHRLNAASWEGEGEPNNGGHLCSFHLGFIDDGLAQAIIFPDFASRVLPLVGGSTEIKLNVEDTLSGTIRGTIGFDDVQATPTLFPNLFESLTVTEVVADVVDGYLSYVKEFVAPDCRKGFPTLRCITLRTIPSDEVVVDPDSTVRCGLEDFIDTVSQAYYEVAPGHEVPVDKRNLLTVTLEGRFGVAAATIRDLGDGGDVERAGVRINRSRGSVYCITPTM